MLIAACTFIGGVLHTVKLKADEGVLTRLQRDRAALALQATTCWISVLDKAPRVLVAVRGDFRLSLTACYLLHTYDGAVHASFTARDIWL